MNLSPSTLKADVLMPRDSTTGTAREEYFNLPLADDAAAGVVSKTFVLVIYDISDDRYRNKLVEILEGYGYRVQYSAFEAMLTKRQLVRLSEQISRFASKIGGADCIRIYRLRGTGEVTFYGPGHLPNPDDVVFV